MSKDKSVLDNPELKNLAVKKKHESAEKNGRPTRNAGGKFVKGNPGGGRPKGSKNIFSKKAAAKLGEMGLDPLEFMAQMMADPDLDPGMRLRAAEQLVAFAYSKQPTMSEVKHDGEIPVMNVAGIVMPGEESEEDDNVQH